MEVEACHVARLEGLFVYIDRRDLAGDVGTLCLPMKHKQRFVARKRVWAVSASFQLMIKHVALFSTR